MRVKEFSLERIQSLYENTVEFNLSDSGVHPYDLRSLLGAEEIEALLSVEMGYGWTNGSVALREAIARLYKDRTADEVIVTNGGAEANFLMATTILDPGDEIIVITPNYLQIAGWAEAIGAIVRAVPLDAARGWRLDLDAIRAAVTPRTKLITVCTPNNPTGAVLDDAERAALVDLARAHGLWLHADEIYKGSELDGPEPPSFADLYEKAIVTNGLSKAMALPGLRIGWLCGPAAEIYGAWQRKDYTSITTAALSEAIAEKALQPDLRRRILDRSKTLLRENLDLLTRWVAANPHFTLTPPRAGGMAFLRYDLPVNSTELAHRMRKDHGVLVLPGDVYGLDGHIRIGIGAPKTLLSDGLARVSEAVRSMAT